MPRGLAAGAGSKLTSQISPRLGVGVAAFFGDLGASGADFLDDWIPHDSPAFAAMMAMQARVGEVRPDRMIPPD
jgi:hypothetical protein